MGSVKLNKSFLLSKKLTAQDRDKQLDKAVKMYEKQFLNQMVKAMRKTVTHSKMTKPGMAEKIYSDQMYQKYVDQWSDQGGVGLAQIIKQQIKEKYMGAVQLPKAKGPIEINPSKAIKIKKQESEGKALPLGENRDMSLLLPPAKPGESVVSPWSGKVTSVLRGESGERVLRLDHGQGVSSLMSFFGTDSALKIGDEVEAGQELGKISHLDEWLAWKVT